MDNKLSFIGNYPQIVPKTERSACQSVSSVGMVSLRLEMTSKTGVQVADCQPPQDRGGFGAQKFRR